MISIWETTFLVVDVETTGSNAEKNRLTEVACVLVRGGEIISDFSSLVNPHQFIPPYISTMTGITNDMAFRAPEAGVVLKEVEKIFPSKDGIFVAHNVKFDWTFMQTSFMREKIHIPAIPQLCTVKLARRLLPQNIKKNVGALAQYFNIPISNRHRAYDDAKATALFLIELLEIAEAEHNISTMDELLRFQNQSAPHYRPMASQRQKIEAKINLLPDAPGVYYFRDKLNNIIYIGKAKSLKKRINSYFTHGSLSSKRIIDMVQTIGDLTWKECPTELHALILESNEIKSHKPHFNRADKKDKKYPFIKLTLDDDFPKLEVSHQVQNDAGEYYGPFRNVGLVTEVFKIIDSSFKLRKCDILIDPLEDTKPCFFFHIDRCDAPCAAKISKEDYSEEMQKVQRFLNGFSNGIVNELEEKMHEFAEALDFEKAAELKNQINDLRRLFSRQQHVPTSINHNNVVLITQNSAADKTFDIFFIKSGLLKYHETFGRKANIDKVLEKITAVYFQQTLELLPVLNEELINELRIINSWVYKQKEKSFGIYVDNFTITEIETQIKSAIQNMSFEIIPDEELSFS